MDARPALRQRLISRPARPMIVAHRGVWGDAPENALPAIEAARAYDMVEIDVQLSADGVPVLVHDPTLDRTAGLPARVDALTAARLAAVSLRAGLGGPDAAMTPHRVPTLEEGLQAGGPGLLFDLDVKAPHDIEAVAAQVAAHPARDRCMLKMDVAAPEDIAALRAVERRHGLCVIAKTLLNRVEDVTLLEAARDAGIAAAEIWFADPDLLARATATSLPITTYTLRDVHNPGLDDGRALTDPGAVWGLLIDTGIAAIMTDEAAALARYLDNRV